MFLYAKTENTENKVQIILNVGKKYGANKYVGTKCSEKCCQKNKCELFMSRKYYANNV